MCSSLPAEIPAGQKYRDSISKYMKALSQTPIHNKYNIKSNVLQILYVLNILIKAFG